MTAAQPIPDPDKPSKAAFQRIPDHLVAGQSHRFIERSCWAWILQSVFS